MRIILVISLILLGVGVVWADVKPGNNPPSIRKYPVSPIKVKALNPVSKPLNFTYNFTHFGVAEGLSQSQTYCVFVDSREIVWIGTYGGGLVKYDGEHFTTYSKKNGLPDNIIWEILEDEHGNLWMACDKGLIKYDGKKFDLKLTVEDLGSDVIRSMMLSSDNYLWLGTSETGIHKYDYKNDSILLRLSPDFLVGEEAVMIWAICEDSSNNMWFSINRKGLVKYDGNTPHLYTPNDGLGHDLILDILCASDGSLWAATGMGASRYNGVKFENYNTDDGLCDDWIRTIFQSQSGDLYFGTSRNGVSVYREEIGFYKSFTKNEGLPFNTVTNIVEDRTGNFWFASLENGIAKYEGETFRHLYPNPENTELEVNAVFESSDGKFWFGTSNGLYFLLDNALYLYTVQEGLSNDWITSLTEDKMGNLWIGTEKGLMKFDGTYFYHYFKDNNAGLTNDVIRGISIDKKGIIWISTDWGLCAIVDDHVAWFTEAQGLAYYLTKTVFTDSKGNSWVGTYGGGLSIRLESKTMNDTNQFITFSGDGTHLGSNYNPTITEDRSGNIWILSYGESIDIIKSNWREIKDTNDWFVHLDYSNGLINANIFFMVEDDRGDMWLGTIEGVDRIAKADQSVKSGNFSITHYGYDDGYKGVESNRNACLKDSKGYLWFSSGNMITRYNPDLEMKKICAPLIQITNIRLFFNDVDWAGIEDITYSGFSEWYGLPEDLVLPYDQNHISFDFIGISHKMTRNVKYQWKLENFDQDWSPPSSDHVAVYANIPPGEYEFLVKAMNAEGNWNETPARFKFSIQPPFWATWWFRLIVIVLLTAIFLGIITWRTRSLRIRQKILEQTVKERTAEVIAQKEVVEEQHQEIMDSITYAKRIQEAILPVDELIQTCLPQSFVLYKPKDIVAGDFYWLEELDDVLAFAVADCTGHGVPGAMVSVVCYNALNRAVREYKLSDPGQILDKTRELVIETLARRDKEVKDGMDIALCIFESSTNRLLFSGANNSLYLIREGELLEIKSDKQPIGIYADVKLFMTHQLDIQKGDLIYIFTDGFADQFGGEKGKKLKYKNFKNLLLELHSEEMVDQKIKLNSFFDEWKGQLEQLDDVCVIGVRF